MICVLTSAHSPLPQGLGSSDTPTLLSTAGGGVQPLPAQQSSTGLLVDVLGDLGGGGAPPGTNGAHAASPVSSELHAASAVHDHQAAVKKSVLGTSSPSGPLWCGIAMQELFCWGTWALLSSCES